MSEKDRNIEYMVEFVLPEFLDEKMTKTIPAQRKFVERYFQTGKLLSYTLAADRSKLWSVFYCQSEAELINLIEKMPMTRYFDYNYHEILFHEMTKLFPGFSNN